jgi:two-component system cell cycle sensor histidine kinase/response regulator CckA
MTRQPRKVLIIEDNPIDREMYSQCLSDAWGADLSVALESTGSSGIRRQQSFKADCIVLDYNLPDMNGLEVLDALKDGVGFSTLPVVMLTGVRDERVAVEAMKRGVMDYVPKGPHAAESLAYAVENAVEKYRLQREVQLRGEALETSESRYRGLIEAIPQIVWTATPDGTLDFFNSRWAEFLGPGNDWKPLVHDDDRERFLQAWAHGISSASSFEVEHRLREFSTGSYRWHLSRAVPIRGEAGQVVKWFGTSTDIEEQKRAEISLLAKQKLESVGLLAGGIAHDFNNILTGILGGASIAIESLPASHELQPVLDNILKSSERAAHLTRQMLAYAGKGRFLIESLDVVALLRSTFELIKASIPKNTEVVLEAADNLPMIEADSGQIQQIAMNLILNAAEAITADASGTVWVRASARDFDRSAIDKLPSLSGEIGAGTYVVIEVEDTGCGMDAETKNKIFDPFFTTKFTGRGLGLSAVQGILRSHKGAIQIESEPGRGSTFRVFLPATQTAAASKPSDLRERVAGASETVLVVDDEEIVRQTARLSLERNGYKVLLAKGGAEAVQLFATSSFLVSLILLDMSMPEMNGKQVMQQIRRLGVEVPVLICSGYSESEVFKEFAGLDIAGVLQKPFTAGQLASRIESVLRPKDRRASEPIRRGSGYGEMV